MPPAPGRALGSSWEPEVLLSEHLIIPELFPQSKRDLMAGYSYHFCANIRLQYRNQIVCDYMTELKGRQTTAHEI